MPWRKLHCGAVEVLGGFFQWVANRDGTRGVVEGRRWGKRELIRKKNHVGVGLKDGGIYLRIGTLKTCEKKRFVRQ